jgi:hypothetical protein
VERLRVLRELADEGVYQANLMLAERIIEQQATKEALSPEVAMSYLYRSAAKGDARALRRLGHFHINRRHQQPKQLFEGLVYLCLASQLDSEGATSDLLQMKIYPDVSPDQVHHAYLEAARRLVSGRLLECGTDNPFCPEAGSFQFRIKPQFYFAAKQLARAKPDRETLTTMLRERLGSFNNYTERRRLRYTKSMAAFNQRYGLESKPAAKDPNSRSDHRLGGQAQNRAGVLRQQAREYFSRTSALSDPLISRNLESLLALVNRHRRPVDRITLDAVRELFDD